MPEHRRSFRALVSPLTGSPRSGAGRANALLNYLYAILETEARIALLAVGLDPGMGVLHADLKARDSLALDVMEAVRPSVDTWELDVVTRRALKSDFYETREGACRLLPPLAGLLAEQAPSLVGGGGAGGGGSGPDARRLGLRRHRDRPGADAVDAGEPERRARRAPAVGTAGTGTAGPAPPRPASPAV